MSEANRIPELLNRLGVLSMRILPSGVIARCNDRVAELIGLSKEQIEGRPYGTFMGQFDIGLASVVQSPLTRTGEEDVVVRWSLTPEFDSEGSLVATNCLGLEVRQDASVPAVVNATLEHTDEGIFLIDGNGRIDRINRIGEEILKIGPSPEGRREQMWSAERASGPLPSQAHISTERVPSREVRVELAQGSGQMAFPPADSTEDPLAVSESRKTKLLMTMRELLVAVIGSGPIEVARRVLAPMAELMGASAAAVVIEVDGESHVESFGLPPETAWLVGDLLPMSQNEPARLQALTRLHLLATVPLRGPQGHLGDVLLFSRRAKALDAEHRDLLEHLSRSLTMALEKILITRELGTARAARDTAHESILKALVAALDLRDHETEGHTQRVTRMSLQLAEKLGLNPEAIRSLEHGALLHDVGKIGIPDAILHKPGPLTPEEWEIMRRHPQFAYDILSPLPLMSHALDVPYCHHERFDGSGYPQGLVGRNIPLGARIFAVVDVFDAMTTERPYRPALPAEFAIAHVRSHAGTHFDPLVVEAFCELIGQSDDFHLA